MNIGFIVLAVVFILGLVILLPIWPWGRTANAADWRALYESAMSEGNPNARWDGIFTMLKGPCDYDKKKPASSRLTLPKPRTCPR